MKHQTRDQFFMERYLAAVRRGDKKAAAKWAARRDAELATRYQTVRP